MAADAKTRQGGDPSPSTTEEEAGNQTAETVEKEVVHLYSARDGKRLATFSESQLDSFTERGSDHFVTGIDHDYFRNSREWRERGKATINMSQVERIEYAEIEVVRDE